MLIAFLECNRSIVGAEFAQVDYVADHSRVSLEATPNRAEQIQTAFGVNRMATNGRKITIVTCFSSGSHPAHFLGKINGLIVCSKGRQSHYKSHGECDDKGNQFFHSKSLLVLSSWFVPVDLISFKPVPPLFYTGYAEKPRAFLCIHLNKTCYRPHVPSTETCGLVIPPITTSTVNV